MAPFFILNAPRSGSTLLALVLDAHPRVSVSLESAWFSYHAIKLRRFTGYPDDRRDEEICRYLKDIEQDKRLVEDEAAVRRAVTEARGDLGRIFENLCTQWSRRRSGDGGIWGEKSCAHALYVEDIRRAFPEAKFIHLIRDPRATIYSLSKKPFSAQSDSTLINIHVWKRYHDRIERSLAGTPASNRLTVYYEDLVADQELQVRRICEFIGLEFDPLMLKHQQLNKEIPRSFGSETAKTAVTASFLEEWKTALSPLQIACVEAVAFESSLIERYERTNLPVSTVAKAATLGYVRILSLALSLCEWCFAHLRGGPFVWSKLGRMARIFLRGK